MSRTALVVLALGFSCACNRRGLCPDTVPTTQIISIEDLDANGDVTAQNYREAVPRYIACTAQPAQSCYPVMTPYGPQCFSTRQARTTSFHQYSAGSCFREAINVCQERVYELVSAYGVFVPGDHPALRCVASRQQICGD